MLVKVERLRIAFRSEGRLSVPVRGISFEIPRNSRVAIVGESGCGKSLTALALGGFVDRAEISGSETRSVPGAVGQFLNSSSMASTRSRNSGSGRNLEGSITTIK